MIELNIQEIESISGAAPDWGQVGAGLASVALGVAIAATPVGVVGAAGAALASFYGGVMAGDGLNGGPIFNHIFGPTGIGGWGRDSTSHLPLLPQPSDRQP